MTQRAIPWPATLVVLAAGAAAALHVAKLPPAIPALQDGLGITLVQAGFLLSLVQGAGMLLGIVIGTAAEGFGLKRSMVVGLSVLTVAGAAGGFVDDLGVLMVLRAVEGLGFLLTSVPAPALLGRLVGVQQRRKVLGMWGTYMPFGTGLALFVGPLVIVTLGWPGWWWLLAAVSAVMAVVVQLVIPADPGSNAPAGPGGPTRPPGANALAASATAQPAAHERWGDRVRTTLTHRGPWLGALIFCLYASQWMAVIGFLPTIYAAAGWVGFTGALLSGIVAFVNLTGSLAAGWLLHRRAPVAVLLIAGLAGQGVGAFLMFATATEGEPVTRYVGALVFSVVGGLVPGALFALAPDFAPSRTTMSTTVGWVQQLSAAGQLIGPPAFAAIVGALGGWQLAWVITAVTSTAGCLLAVALAGDIRRRHGPHPAH